MSAYSPHSDHTGDGINLMAESTDMVGSLSFAGASGPVLRKKFYDTNFSDWTARYRKTKQNLENTARDCDLLRSDAAKQQQELNGTAESLRKLEERYASEVLVRFNDGKAALEMAAEQKGILQVQLSENRRVKAQLTREKKLLKADYERKHAEVVRMAEARDKLEAQFAQLSQQLATTTADRRRMERELDQVQHNLRQNTELADEVHTELEHLGDGIRTCVSSHLLSSTRLETSINSREDGRTP